MKPLTSIYTPDYFKKIVFMLQSSEYKVLDFIVLVWKTKDFSKIKINQTSARKKTTKILLLTSYLLTLLVVAVGILLIILALTGHLAGGVFFGIAVILLYPFILPHVLVLVVLLAGNSVFKPNHQSKVTTATKTSSKK